LNVDPEVFYIFAFAEFAKMLSAPRPLLIRGVCSQLGVCSHQVSVHIGVSFWRSLKPQGRFDPGQKCRRPGLSLRREERSSAGKNVAVLFWAWKERFERGTKMSRACFGPGKSVSIPGKNVAGLVWASKRFLVVLVSSRNWGVQNC